MGGKKTVPAGGGGLAGPQPGTRGQRPDTPIVKAPRERKLESAKKKSGWNCGGMGEISKKMKSHENENISGGNIREW